MTRPPKPHTLLRGNGEPSVFKWLTTRLCPICNPASDGARMGVLSIIEGTASLECEHCGYLEATSAAAVPPPKP